MGRIRAKVEQVNNIPLIRQLDEIKPIATTVKVYYLVH